MFVRSTRKSVPLDEFALFAITDAGSSPFALYQESKRMQVFGPRCGVFTIAAVRPFSSIRMALPFPKPRSPYEYPLRSQISPLSHPPATHRIHAQSSG